jgi:aminocarboxymuconate-semialdehyde decarboxylase
MAMTRTRRDFVKDVGRAAAGALCAASGVAAAGAAWRQSSAGTRRQVTIGGRRIRTVDVHAHCAIPEIWEVVKDTSLAPAVRAQLDGPLVLRPERLQAMNAQGIDVELLSINPFWYGVERDLARRITDMQNDKLAGICAAQPERFAALASVALQDPAVAVEQLEHAMEKLRLRGVATGATVNGEELAAPKFDPFWAKAEQLGATVFIHPQGVPELRQRLQGNGFLTNVIGNPLETTIALSHLIFEGTLDRFPGLTICAAHAGGYLPSYVGRSDQGCVAFPANCTKALKKRPSEYLRQLYVDSMVFRGEGLRHLVAECGPDRVMMGTDYPFPWTTTAVDHVLGAPGLADADRRAILGENASKLLKIPS